MNSQHKDYEQPDHRSYPGVQRLATRKRRAPKSRSPVIVVDLCDSSDSEGDGVSLRHNAVKRQKTQTVQDDQRYFVPPEDSAAKFVRHGEESSGDESIEIIGTKPGRPPMAAASAIPLDGCTSYEARIEPAAVQLVSLPVATIPVGPPVARTTTTTYYRLREPVDGYVLQTLPQNHAVVQQPQPVIMTVGDLQRLTRAPAWNPYQQIYQVYDAFGLQAAVDVEQCLPESVATLPHTTAGISAFPEEASTTPALYGATADGDPSSRRCHHGDVEGATDMAGMQVTALFPPQEPNEENVAAAPRPHSGNRRKQNTKEASAGMQVTALFSPRQSPEPDEEIAPHGGNRRKRMSSRVVCLVDDVEHSSRESLSARGSRPQEALPRNPLHENVPRGRPPSPVLYLTKACCCRTTRIA